jgi:hypothetical protein
MGKKDDKYYEQKRKELKDEKRALTGSIPDSEYNVINSDGTLNNNKTIKKKKEDIKRKQRALKRSEKQQVKKMIDDVVDETEEYEDE